MVVKEIKRVWFITDTHFGVKNNSNEWMDIMKDYFYNWFIPTIKRNYKKGDILIHLGDVYDSRQSLNIRILNFSIQLFEDLSKIFVDGIYILAGNHDLWTKDTNDINSLVTLKWIPNINIIQEPQVLKTDITHKNILLMPWRKDKESENDVLSKFTNNDILCCHTDIKGLKFNKYVNIEKGMLKDDLKTFKRVYSGHIHYGQTSDNITIVGSPYEITRSDMDNKKRICLLDIETFHETSFINDYSPKYKKILFDTLLEKTPDDLYKLFENNFVDIMIDSNITMKTPLSIITDIMTCQRDLKFHPYTKDEENIDSQIISSDGKVLGILDFIKLYLNNMEETDDIKNKIYDNLSKLYQMVLNQNEENK